MVVLSLLSLSKLSVTIASDENVSITCDKAITDSHRLNAHELWQGMSECVETDDLYRATFLLLAGQIRAMTDMTMLKPASDEDEIKIGELYGILYYQVGGSGEPEIYRDMTKSKNLFNKLQDWEPEISESYNPSWNYMSNVDVGQYAKMVVCQKAIRINKLNWYAGLIQNDEYYQASKKLNTIRKGKSGPIETDTDIEKQVNTIMSRMREVSANIPPPKTKFKVCEFAQKYGPDPDADFHQLHVGSNGPNHSQALVFVSQDEVMESWLSNALTHNVLKTILEQIDFNNQILVSLSFGKRQNATGTVFISDINYNSVLKSLSISRMVGVNESECKEPNSDSYPFVLAMKLQTTPDSLLLANCKP